MGVQPINKVLTVSGGQQRDSALHIHASILPQRPLSYSGWHMTLISRSLLVIHFKWSSIRHWFDLLF